MPKDKYRSMRFVFNPGRIRPRDLYIQCGLRPTLPMLTEKGSVPPFLYNCDHVTFYKLKPYPNPALLDLDAAGACVLIFVCKLKYMFFKTTQLINKSLTTMSLIQMLVEFGRQRNMTRRRAFRRQLCSFVKQKPFSCAFWFRSSKLPVLQD